MLYRDGTHQFYTVQYMPNKKGEWKTLGHLPKILGELLSNIPEEIDKGPFDADGACQLTLGITYATYDLDNATRWMRLLAEYNPNHMFRVIRVVMAQHVEQVAMDNYF